MIHQPSPRSSENRAPSLRGRGEWGARVVLYSLAISWLLIIPTDALELNGSYENDALLGLKRGDNPIAGDLNRLRLKINAELRSNLRLYLEPRYYLFPASQTVTLTGASQLDRLVWDKVYLKVNLPLASVTLGKQRIAWGTGYIWNPTDVSNPQTLSFAVGEEDETNVEAVRVEVPIGEASGIDGYVLTGGEWSNTQKGIRVRNNIGLFDYSLSYVDLGTSSFLLGFDTAGELLGLGVRGEIAYRSPAGSNAYAQSVWGADYTFENGTYVNLEYYNNGLGKKNKDNYDWATSIRGMDNLYFGASKIMDEITRISGSAIFNLNDYSFLIYPSFSRNVAENVDLNLEAMVLGGEEGSQYYPPAANDPTGFGGSKIGLIRVKYSF